MNYANYNMSAFHSPHDKLPFFAVMQTCCFLIISNNIHIPVSFDIDTEKNTSINNK